MVRSAEAVRLEALKKIPQGLRVEALESIKRAIESEIESLRAERELRVQAIRRVGHAIKAFEAMGREVEKDIAASKEPPAPKESPKRSTQARCADCGLVSSDEPSVGVRFGLGGVVLCNDCAFKRGQVRRAAPAPLPQEAVVPPVKHTCLQCEMADLLRRF